MHRRQRHSTPVGSFRNSLVVGCIGLAVLAQSAAGLAGDYRLPLSSTATQVVGTTGDEAIAALEQAGRYLARVAATTTPSVVHIESIREGRSGTIEETGSGVVMSSPRSRQLFVVTNRHVVANANLEHIEIRLGDKRVFYPARKIEDPDSDIAVLTLRERGLVPAQWGDSDNLDIGHFVLAMGSPFGLSQSVTLGIISAKGRRSLELPGRRVINQDFLQTDAAINPGNSGGPLIDLHGRVVGINTAIASQGGGNEGIGFSIPSNLARFIVEQLLEHGRVRRGYLGVELDENFDDEAAARYGLPHAQGARVVRVYGGTPAESAGIQRDDVIINFDGVDIQDETDLINRVSLTPVNSQVRVLVVRGQSRLTLQVTLTEREAPARSAVPEERIPSGNRLLENAGFEVWGLDRKLSLQLGYSPDLEGVLVRRIPDGWIGDASALQLYDVITEVARQPVRTPTEFDARLAERDRSAPVVLKVRRFNGDRLETLLVLLPPQGE